jgi:hypothetical protein
MTRIYHTPDERTLKLISPYVFCRRRLPGAIEYRWSLSEYLFPIDNDLFVPSLDSPVFYIVSKVLFHAPIMYHWK